MSVGALLSARVRKMCRKCGLQSGRSQLPPPNLGGSSKTKLGSRMESSMTSVGMSDPADHAPIIFRQFG